MGREKRNSEVGLIHAPPRRWCLRTVRIPQMIALFLFLVVSALWKALRRDWKHAGWFGAGAAFMMLVGSTPLVHWLVERSEGAYANGSGRSELVGDAVIMLGGMHTISAHDSFSITVREAADRFITAVEIVRQGAAPVLVIGGTPRLPGSDKPSAPLVHEWVRQWDLAEGELLDLGLARNTFEEAVQARELAAKRGWKRLVLVTSALHMKRAQATFRKQGLEVIPVECSKGENPKSQARNPKQILKGRKF